MCCLKKYLIILFIGNISFSLFSQELGTPELIIPNTMIGSFSQKGNDYYYGKFAGYYTISIDINKDSMRIMRNASISANGIFDDILKLADAQYYRTEYRVLYTFYTEDKSRMALILYNKVEASWTLEYYYNTSPEPKLIFKTRKN